jgi:hypothetical protein
LTERVNTTEKLRSSIQNIDEISSKTNINKSSSTDEHLISQKRLINCHSPNKLSNEEIKIQNNNDNVIFQDENGKNTKYNWNNYLYNNVEVPEHIKRNKRHRNYYISDNDKLKLQY